MGVDYIDESEVLTPADEEFHINKHDFKVPFVCGAKNLGEALRRIGEGAALMRTKGEPGTGNIVEAVRHMRRINEEIRRVVNSDDAELMTMARDMGAPFELLKIVKAEGKLPVPNFAAGGIATPADTALCMQLGANDPAIVLEASKELGGVAMRGTEISEIDEPMLMANRGW